MKFIDIHQKVIALWPHEIQIADNGMPNENADGHYFPSLSGAWHEMENIVGHDEHYEALMVWTHFQLFHLESMRLIRDQKSILQPAAVDLVAIEKRYFENLHTEGYEQELKAYERNVE